MYVSHCAPLHWFVVCLNALIWSVNNIISAFKAALYFPGIHLRIEHKSGFLVVDQVFPSSPQASLFGSCPPTLHHAAAAAAAALHRSSEMLIRLSPPLLSAAIMFSSLSVLCLV